MNNNVIQGPHQTQPILHAGEPLAGARAALILVHGRGGMAADILALAGEVGQPSFAYLAPQAAGNTWYPYPFLAPLAQNEPGLSSGLARIGEVVAQVEAAGIPTARVVLLGFSQGACLALEWAARHAQRFGAVVGLSGGLIGPDGTPRNYAGSFEGTPVLLGCSDADSHIPKARVLHTAEVLRGLGAAVDLRLYPRMGHTINADELTAVRALLTAVRVGTETR